MRWIDVEGIRTRVHEDGSGQTLMLLHGGQFGMFSSLDSWSLNLPSLAESFQVVAIDKLGQGHTDNPKSDDDYTFEAMYDHMLAAIDALGLENIVLLGHSRGGLPAVRIAIERPRLVNKLIIVDSNTASPDPAMASTSTRRSPAKYRPISRSKRVTGEESRQTHTRWTTLPTTTWLAWSRS